MRQCCEADWVSVSGQTHQDQSEECREGFLRSAMASPELSIVSTRFWIASPNNIVNRTYREIVSRK